LFGCHTGLRVSDWLQFDLNKNVTKTRLILNETEKNEALISMPLTHRLREIVDLLKNEPKPKSRNTFNRVQQVLRKCGIDKKITSHCGRKTFAVTMCAERGISVETCAELMGITIQVCRTNYYEVTQKKIDREVLEAWTHPSIGRLQAV
jgi:integrase